MFGREQQVSGQRQAYVKNSMEMHQVRYFLAVCEELSFCRAARRCGVSQPSLSNAISALEHSLGGALFLRKPSIALTVLGCAIRPYLEEIARNADGARDVAHALVHGSARPITGQEVALIRP
jgi:DNA-binding transcriptional LysR family regulator